MKKLFYTEPLIEEMEVAIEQGIATSPGSPGNAGGMDGDDSEYDGDAI